MPPNRNLRSVAAALLSLAMTVLLLAACPAEDHQLNSMAGDPYNVPPTMAPGPAPMNPLDERALAHRASRSRVEAAAEAAEAAAAAERRRILAEAAARAEQRQRDARALMTAERPVAGGDVWRALASCESGDGKGSVNPRAVGGGGRYFGAFQFSLGTWRSVGGTGNPIDHDYGTQLSFAQKLQARSGWGQWPHCSRKLGLR